MNVLDSSFRDPDGFVFYKEDGIFRQVNESYRSTYHFLEKSGLLKTLFDKKYLVRHEKFGADGSGSGFTLKPQFIPFISYPYEWSLGQLKDAALLTLDIQKQAIEKGMTLKDASAYNIQFYRGKPIFIDTLSFEIYQEGQPWVAYRQFCQHFLAPLLLMKLADIRLGRLLTSYIDGIPLDLASKLLPATSYLNFHTLVHIHLHARQQIRHGSAQDKRKRVNSSVSRHGMLALIDSLRSAITSVNWQGAKTEWDDYYADNNNYSAESMDDKERLVTQYLSMTDRGIVWDIGANDGRFSRLASKIAELVISWDIDPVCVQRNYQSVKDYKQKNILPLVLDLFNPSPSIGWANCERESFSQRGKCNVLLALGLIHHIAISNNVPLARIAEYFAKITNFLIVEWVPKSDSQVRKLLATRKDLFGEYDISSFEREFRKKFDLVASQRVLDSERSIYLMKVKKSYGSE